ncbi:unnamed protein product [Meloidogyne enterolobii]|uniref:Uncharacterized protein n=1 Tax=Meloidogyne enterolobii TaxID=390850 RepID=A0ACB1AU82_MELEN
MDLLKKISFYYLVFNLRSENSSPKGLYCNLKLNLLKLKFYFFFNLLKLMF